MFLTKSIQVRRTRHTGHCWRSKDEIIRDVLLWTPAYGQAKAGRPARTYIQQLCEDTGCSSEDLPEAMNNREKWRERVRNIRAIGTTWWWWWYYTTSVTDTTSPTTSFVIYVTQPIIIKWLFYLNLHLIYEWRSGRLELLNTPTESLQKGNTTPKYVMDMTK